MKKIQPEPSTLQVLAGFDRTLIRRKGESVRFLVAEVTAPIVESFMAPMPPKAPLNLALVIDASGSMAGRPIEAAKEAARRVAQSLGATDRLSVISFDTEVTVHIEGRLQDAAGQAAATSAIAALEAGSSTDLGGGWLQGCACVAKVMEAQPGLRNRVVVLSDGQANHGITEPDALATHAAQLRARGLLSSAVGIGDGYSDVQLGAIAASGGGRLHHAAKAAEIVELVLGELDELRETVVESCDLAVERPSGFVVEVVGDYARDSSAHRGRRLSCVLGSLSSGGQRTVVFKVTCPAGKLGDSAELKIAAKWKGVGAEQVIATPTLVCELQFATGDKCLAQPRDKERALVVARTWQFEIVRAATRLNQDGELHRAGEFVARELVYFKRYCQGLLGAQEMVAALERLATSIGQDRYAPMAAKEMTIASIKGNRGERELRSSIRSSWDTHLPQ
jgi:Ca-activated chloride channel family protein